MPYPLIELLYISVATLKYLVFFVVLLPLECFAQFNISGRILNQADSKPIANSNVFLSHATIGSKTADKSRLLQLIQPNLTYQLTSQNAFCKLLHQTQRKGNHDPQ
jgi:hypothetical protein